MKVLVTGGAGYIGAHVVDILCDSGYDVLVFDDLSSGFMENLNKKSIFINGSTLSESDLDETFKRHSIDAVIHLAAFKSPEESMLNPNKYTKNNIIGSINLITYALKYKINKFIFSSTAAVYGNPEYIPMDEKHPLNPVNHYGFTKLFVEDYLEWINKITDMKFVSLRYFNATGYTSDISLIKRMESNPANLLPIVMEVANGKRKLLEVYGNDYDTDDGTCIRDYVHVLDLASAHIKALQYLDSNDSLTVNLGTKRGYSVLDVIGVTEEVIKTKINYKISDRRVGDPPVIISSSGKAYNKLGWHPQHSDIEEIISSMWKIYNSN